MSASTQRQAESGLVGSATNWFTEATFLGRWALPVAGEHERCGHEQLRRAGFCWIIGLGPTPASQRC